MSIFNYLPFPVYIVSIVILMTMLLWGSIKGAKFVHSAHLLPSIIAGFISGVMLITARVVKEFNIYFPWPNIIDYIIYIMIIIIIINVFKQAWPIIRANRTLFRIMVVLIIAFLICVIVFLILLHL